MFLQINACENITNLQEEGVGREAGESSEEEVAEEEFGSQHSHGS